MKKALLLVFTIFFSLSSFAQTPATEIRAIWLTTNWALDWPSLGVGTKKQKEELCEKLDQIKKDKFNVVFFQARAQGKAFYNSKIESKIYYFDKKFDPLEFAIEECHKRGLECHAWLVMYPMGTAKGKKVPINKKDYWKLSKGQWYLDPGDPRSQAYLLSIVNEIVKNYDIDGIHLDYMRYPNKDKSFPDTQTYAKYGKKQKLHDWRRNNITQLVTSIYNATKAQKKWVQVSSSPIGKYQILKEVNPNDGWTAYDIVFQDAVKWINQGKHDMLFPMLYYKDSDFYPFLNDWLKKTNKGFIVPGLGIYQMLPNERNWDSKTIVEEIKYTRSQKLVGQAFYRTDQVLKNLKGIEDSIKSIYTHQAKLPALTWLDDKTPPQPVHFQIEKDATSTVHFNWDTPPTYKQLTYTIYVTSNKFLDKENGTYILETGIRGNHFSFNPIEGDFGYYYTITASDRFHNESEPCHLEFLSHSKHLK